MKIKNNRFAIVPIRCTECQKYVWLETYRHGEKHLAFIGSFIKVNICNDCSKKYTYGS